MPIRIRPFVCEPPNSRELLAYSVGSLAACFTCVRRNHYGAIESHTKFRATPCGELLESPNDGRGMTRAR